MTEKSKQALAGAKGGKAKNPNKGFGSLKRKNPELHLQISGKGGRNKAKNENK